MTIIGNNGSDDSSQGTEDTFVVVDGEDNDEHSAEATTMTENEDENQANDEHGDDGCGGGGGDVEKIDGKCTIEVCSTELVGRPPPDYSLTSPCLPPNSPREQDWPPEPPPPFDGYPPYPAGPPLLKIAYPKDVPGPTYACPKCEGRFLYYRPAGIVQCPFCHSAISIGRYVRIRACSLIMFGLVFLLSSLTFGLANMFLLDSSGPYFIVVGMTTTSGLILLFRAVHMFSRYRETERIEFT